MATRRASFDDKLAHLKELAANPPAAAANELRRYLADANGYLVGEAARVATNLELRELIPDLAAACTRLIAAPMTADKGCHGKKLLVQALIALDAATPEVYLAGLRHVQKEPAFGPPIDTASTLRGLCAHALVHMDHRDAALEVAPLLMDPEPDTRSAAADALAATGEEVCAAILHVKTMAGDKEPDVLGACYRGMLALSPRRYLRVVAKALTEEETQESAAIALGESRLPEALPVLQEALGGAGGSLQNSILLGIALLRLEEANAYLVRLVEEASEGRAAAAVEALALHRHDEKLAAQVRAAVEGRGSRKVMRAWEERFG